MGIYSKFIFPSLLEWALDREEVGEYRRTALAPASGKTLEIGFGTGLNLPFYPVAVTGLTVIDSERMLPKRVEDRLACCPVPITRLQHDAQRRLPFETHSFDTVVTTLTLCSIDQPALALFEIRRVLKPTGQFIFWEHGRSQDPAVAARQDRYNPIQRVLGAGCNMNRRIDDLIEDAEFEISTLERFLMPNTPRVLGEMYRGVAVFGRGRGE